MSIGLLTRRLNLPLFRGCAYIPIAFYELRNGFLTIISTLVSDL